MSLHGSGTYATLHMNRKTKHTDKHEKRSLISELLGMNQTAKIVLYFGVETKVLDRKRKLISEDEQSYVLELLHQVKLNARSS